VPTQRPQITSSPASGRWNIDVHLLIARGAAVNAAILVALAVLVLVPIRYVYPTRTRTFRITTNVAGAIWGGLMLTMLWQYPAVPRPLFIVSLAFPVYYGLLSLGLHFRLIRSDIRA
jgi:phosphatidylcholine synthase